MHMANDCYPPKAAGKPERRTIISRELLYEGGQVKFYIPGNKRNSRMHYIPEPDAADTFKYLCVVHIVKGGEVHVHVHAEDPKALRGRSVLAHIEVWKTLHFDGGHSIHVDLRWPRVVNGKNKQRTHKFRVVPSNSKNPEEFATARKFDLPLPLEGAVLIKTVRNMITRLS